RLLFIDTAFQTLKLDAEDSSGRQHILTVKLKSKHPFEAPDCSADLPIPLLLNWTPQTSLEQLYGQFLLVLESLTRFWDTLDEIDRKTWILEPEKPCRSDTMRRIAIGSNVSIKVEVDPRHPEMLPDCCLLGAEHVVTPLRNKLNTNMHLWFLNCPCDLKHLCTPVFAQSFSAECGICYSISLWKIPSLIRCVTTLAVAKLSSRSVCTSGCVGFPLADRALMSFLEIVLTAASQLL
ncbi:unnamed protein product, partial [Tetraodon nigroviridis]